MVSYAFNQYTVLGSLVDRAICMPYARPQVLQNGRRRRQKSDGSWETLASIQEDVANATYFISRALHSSDAQNSGSAAACLLDPGGPWWTTTRDAFFYLGEAERKWVIGRLLATTETAALGLERKAISENWTWLWSQPPLVSPGQLRPKFTYPDLIGGLGRKKCDIIDLKTTKQKDLISAVPLREQDRKFDKWRRALASMSFEPRYCWALSVSSVESEYKWVTY